MRMTELRATLHAAKGDQTISVCIPARNEQATVAKIVESIRDELMAAELPLVDEVLVLDDRSTDKTAEVAEAAGATVVQVQDVLPELVPGQGKGNVLWKSVAASHGDLIVWVDADLSSFTPAWIAKLVEPMLLDASISMVKGYYERPEVGDKGGGRTTELMARPVLGTFFPELGFIRQPLGGEYAARREVLERVPFSMGYGVETGLLIDITKLVGIEGLAQVDLGVRVHRHRPLSELGVQAMEVLHAALQRADIEWQSSWGDTLTRPDHEPVRATTDMRPPLSTVPGYSR